MTAQATTPGGVLIGPVSSIPLGEGRTFRVGTVSIAVFRTRAGEVYATQAYCPHRNGPLADGLIGEGKVVCPLHGYAFHLDSGEPHGQECAALRTFPVTIDPAGNIVVEMDGDEG